MNAKVQNRARILRIIALAILLSSFSIGSIPIVADNWERHISGAYEVTEFDGTGEIIAVFDTGAAWQHDDFDDSGIVTPNFDGQIIEYMYGSGIFLDEVGHGTALAGIIGGTGIGDGTSGGMPSLSDACGIAKGARMVIQDNTMATPSSYIDVFRDAWLAEARLHVNGRGTSSGPSGYNNPGIYSADSADIDAAIYGACDMLVFFPSGDDPLSGGTYGNPGFLNVEAAAKNVISVGGFHDRHTTTLTDDRVSDEASVGPTKDNRVKPDLLGQHYISKTTDVPGAGGYSLGNYYDGFDGTSGAAAYVGAISADVRQMYKSNHFKNNPIITSGDDVPHAATLKALLIANAYQLDMTENTRFEQGWGEPNLSSIYNVGQNHLIIDETYDLAQGESVTFIVEATEATDLKITLVWTDPPGDLMTLRALVNNLDLEVRNGANVWYGNMGLENSHYSKKAWWEILNEWDTDIDVETNTDDLNNVENVFIEKTEAHGLYEITVRASEVNFGATQNFALVASGVSIGTGLACWPQESEHEFLAIMTDVTVAVSDSNLNNAEGEPFDTIQEIIPASNVRVFSDTDPTGINVMLLETAVDSRLFTAKITLTKTGSSDTSLKTLKVSEGDKLTIEYSDQAPAQQITTATTIFLTESPLARKDVYSVEQDNPLMITAPGILGNDLDLLNSVLTPNLISGPLHGVLELSADGSFTYTPDTGYYGVDYFTYVANNGYQDSNAAFVVIAMSPTSPIEIELAQGWNMISLPLLPKNNAAYSLLSNLTGVYLYHYDASVEDVMKRWKSFDITAPELYSQINTLTNVEPYKAYWIWVNTAGKYVLNGAIVLENEIHLYEGWNFVGFQLINDDVVNTLRQLSGPINLYHYKATEPDPTKRWLIYDNTNPPEFNTLQKIEPTKGYWLWVDYEQTWQAESDDIGEAPISGITSSSPEIPRTFWSRWGNSKLNEQPLPVGTVITAYDPDGILCGSCEVAVEGAFTITCIGDNTGTPEDEGAQPGDLIAFFINGFQSTVTGGSAIWQSGYQEVNIESTYIVTEISVDTDPRTVNKEGDQTTKIFGYLESDGAGLEGKTVKLYHQYASTEYGEPSDGTWTYIASVTTVTDGYYEHYWNPDDSLENGFYWIKAEFEGDGECLKCSKTTGIEAASNLHVIPESVIGTIGPIVFAIAGLRLYTKKKQH